MKQSQIQKAFPVHFFLRRLYSLTGVVSLYLLVKLHFIYAAVILFGPADFVQQGTRGTFAWSLVGLLELVLITVPLLVHFLYGFSLAHRTCINVFSYGYGGNLRFVLQKICGIVVFVFLLYHLFKSGQALWDDEGVYSYFRGLAGVRTTMPFLIGYAIAILCGCYYFVNGLWGFLIDWGVTASRRSQHLFLLVLMFLFVLMLLFIAGIVVYQGTLQT
ncbi:MAG: hypothetical protein HQM16_04795 [Deltaproteobacteria bacterium]|nr:hypothetical protein [Deltaproteobacteria bacterium]